MPQIHPGLACLTLAAGGGTRLGGGKLLLPWKGRPLVVHALEKSLAAPGLASVVLVLGHQAAALRHALKDVIAPDILPFLRIAYNARWREGQSTSLLCGIQALLNSPEADALESVLVLLGDQTLVKEDTIRLLCMAHNEARADNTGHAATVPTYRGKRGNPVILSRILLPSLLTLSGDTGARGLLTHLGENLLRLPVDDRGVLLDVDTPQDYADLLAR
ncbi:MAG: nucleotidyltransferase family protein [Desulfovibrio sp.]|jgi:molybdenum cofactor cytidylyltransferase|nr:nucleotidyltransferase family protein [Desulfovibrio sp.]